MLSYIAYGQNIPIEEETKGDSILIPWFSEEDEDGLPFYDFFKLFQTNRVNDNPEEQKNVKFDLTDFHMPCKKNKITSSYGYRKAFRRYHMGTDIDVSVGDTIYTVFDGVVSLVTFDKNGYGRFVKVEHNNGLETLYAHMSKQLVSKGQIVCAGEPVGLGGSTGRSTGPHLHFEVRLSGKHINPQELFSFEHRKPLMDGFLIGDNGKIIKTEIIKEETAENKTQEEVLHKVKRGETLALIAKKYKTTVEELKKMNGLTRNTIYVGQVLRCS